MSGKELPHAGHRDRVREIVEKGGFKTLPDYQKLEFLLFNGILYKDTKQIAYSLLERFGSLKNIFSADVGELVKVKNMTKNAALILRSYNEIFESVYNTEKIRLNSDNIVPFVHSLFTSDDTERLIMICLDDNNEVLSKEILTFGSVDRVSIPKPDLFAKILTGRTKKVILAHNHPSGILAPSQADFESNEQIKNLLTTFEIEFLDHFIVADDCVYSCYEGVRIRADQNSAYPKLNTFLNRQKLINK